MERFILRSQEATIPGYPDWLARLLHARGVHTVQEAEAFLSPSLGQLNDPFLLDGMGKAVALIKELGARKARAVVYGDYDVDGLCAAVIMEEALKAAGLKVIIYIPDRHSEGYGLNKDAIERLAGQAELLISVDCGITAAEEVALAKQLGLKVIITDHHQPPSALPDADAVINPLLGDCPFVSLCGAGTAWKLSCALMGMDFAKKQLDLAAIATIADLVPLLHENRVIASLGLSALENTRREGLKALIASMGMEPGQPVSSDRIAFGLAPRLNAGGRLTTAQAALQLLRSTRQQEAQELAGELSELNRERQAQQAEVTEQAEALLKDADLLHSHSIVVCGSGWNAGVVGLAAGKLAEKYAFPSVVLTEMDGICQGSARSAGSIDLYAALKSCADLFERFGGHKAAAGLSLKKENLTAFQDRFEQAVLSQLDGRPLLKERYYDAEIDLRDVTIDAVEKLERLRPFGMGNPAPAFLIKDVKTEGARRVGQEGKHLKLRLSKGDESRDAIGFGLGDGFEALPPDINALVELSINRFQGRVTAQCQLHAYLAGERAFEPRPEAELDALVQDLSAIASNVLSGQVAPKPMAAPEGYRGSLLVCRSAETAESMHRQYPDFAVAVGPVTDRRGDNALLYRTPLSAVRVAYESVYLCDGLIHPDEAAYVQSLFPGASIHAAPPSRPLQAMREDLRLTVDELRDAYVRLRQGEGLDLTMPVAKQRLALLVLEELRLITLESGRPEMLPLRKCDPQESRLFRLIR